MEDKFDRILKDKIKELTEKSDISYNPEHWDLLLTNKEKRKKRLLFFWRIAAFFLVALLAGGIGKFLINSFDSENEFNPQIILDDKNDSVRIDSLKNYDKILITSSDFDSINKTNLKISQTDSINIKNKAKQNLNKYFKSNSVIVSNDVKTKVSVITSVEAAKILNDSVNENIKITINNLITEDEIITQSTDKDLVKDGNLNNDAISIVEQEIKNDSLNIKKDIALLKEKEEYEIEIENKKTVKLGIDLSPLYNYNRDVESSNIGFAGGITVDIPISNKFDINTGVFYSDQTLNLNKTNTYLSDIVSSKSSSQLKSKEAVITGIEIPVNLKYNFSINKNKLFVSAGFTSTSYLKEDIEANYLVNNRIGLTTQDMRGNNIVKYELVPTENKIVTSNNSNGFNFANVLNLSIGIELPLNKELQSIIIAPYYKYSLTPVTLQNIDFSSAGVHLRYIFNLSNKN